MQCNTTQGACNSTLTFSASTNRITASGFAYDAAGNLTAAPGQTYQYDAEGRLTGAVKNGVTDTYWYDAVGERSQESVSSGEKQIYWNAFRQRAVVYNRKTEDEDLYPPVAGRTYMKYKNSRTDYLHVNALGTTGQITDQSGIVQQDQTFYPLGVVWQNGNDEDDDTRFASLDERDPDTGLDPTRARMYYSNLGRWMTPDPDNAGADPGDPQTWNAYAYARNGPTTFTDPDGLDCIYASNWSTNSVTVGVETGDCSQPGGTYVNGTIDTSSLTLSNGNLGYSYSNGETGVNGTGVVSQPEPEPGLQTLSLAGNMAAPGVNLAFEGLQLFGSFAAPWATALAQYLAGAPGSSKANLAVALLPDSFAAGETAKIAAGLKPAAEGAELQGLINELYKPSDTLPGGTAGAVRHELATGQRVGGRLHSIKAGNTVRWLDNLLSSGKLSSNDVAIAQALKADLQAALVGK